MRPPEANPSSRTLSPLRRAVYATGDFTINASLNALSFVYTGYFLLHIAGLRPALAGLVPLIARTVDAFTDPLMGRISDRTRWRWGRRRPYFLLGAVPFGVTFSLLWLEPPFASDAARFAYYAGMYSLLTTAMTVLSIPYLSLQPEMATGYDDRTSLNTYRATGAILGVFAAISMRPLANWFGGGAEGFLRAGCLLGTAFALPWFAVYAVSFELGMLLFLSCVVAAFPVWLRISRRTDKMTLFRVGAAIWLTVQGFLIVVGPDTTPAVVFAVMAVAGFGYAAVDVMPWSMLGEVIDEDELRTGERREGLFHGLFTFFRKLGGALGVAVVLGTLELAGFRAGGNANAHSAEAIRWLTALAPAAFLAAALVLARGYPLTRSAHARLLRQLAERRAMACATQK